MLPRRFFLCFISSLGLAACSGPSLFSAGEAEIPDVSLAGLSFAEPGLLEQELTVQLRLKNPNDFDIPVDGLNFTLAVNETDFASGLSQEAFTLPSLGEIVVPIAVTIPTRDLIQRVVAVGTGRRLDYQLTGEAEIGSWLTKSVPFLREGRLALPSVPGLNDRASKG